MSRYDGGRLSLIAIVYVGSRGVVDPLELRAHPLPGEPEPLDLGRLDERREVVEQQVGVDPDPVLDEALVAQARRAAPRRSLDARRSGSARPSPSGRPPLGQPGDGAEVEHARAGRGSRRRSGGSGSCPGAGRRAACRCGPGRRTGTARTARRSGRAPPGCRSRITLASEAGLSSHSVTSTGSPDRDHVGHHDVGVVAERLGEGALRLGLELVVELVGGARLHLLDQRLDVDAGDQRRRSVRAEPGELAQVGHQRLAGAGVLHLDRDLAPVVPAALVHLADRRGRGRAAVEPDQLVLPVRRRGRGASWSRTVWVGIGGAESCSRVSCSRYGAGDLLGQRRLEHATAPGRTSSPRP